MVKLIINDAAYRIELARNSTTIILRYATRVKWYAKKYAPKDTGNLAVSIQTTFKLSSSGLPTARVGTNLKYGLYQHEGTGIYGPKNRPIRPKRGKYLVFTGKDGNLVFAKSVRGTPPKRYLTRALYQVFK